MKKKLREYLELIFAGETRDSAASDFMDEIYRNMCDKFDDLISHGRTETDAYNDVISGLGTPGELIDELKNRRRDRAEQSHSQSQSQAQQPGEDNRNIASRSQNGLRAGAIALYILSVVPVIIFSDVAGGAFETIGIVLMFVMIAVATSMLVLRSSGRRDRAHIHDHGETHEAADKSQPTSGAHSKRSPFRGLVKSIIWLLTVALYIPVSIATTAWGYTWLMFIIAIALSNVADGIFEIAEGDN